MKTLLINPIIRKRDKPRHIPHGLAILANVIRRDLKIEPEFLDINAHRYTDRQVEHRIDTYKPDIVLIGGLTPIYNSVIKITDYIKSTYPETLVVCGGSVGAPIPEILLKNSKVDIVCTGEGERTIVELLQNIKRRDIDGISYRKKWIITNNSADLIEDLDKESELPAYDLLPMEIYLNNQAVGLGREVDFISSRGCPYKCTFCYQPWGDNPRLHSADFIIDAIKYLKEVYYIDFIAFQDDEFMINKQRIREFCDKVKDIDIKWSCTGRCNIVTKDESIIKTMKNAGCTSISYGFESGSQEMLDSMNKKQTIEQMEKTVQLNRKYGMPIPASFIIGMPGETEITSNDTLDFSYDNNIPLDSLMFATPYPGTSIYEFALKTNRIGDEHTFISKIKDARDFIINLTDDFTDMELIDKREYMINKSRENYMEYISIDKIEENMKSLYGNLYDKSNIDKKDLEHRFKHGGICVF